MNKQIYLLGLLICLGSPLDATESAENLASHFAGRPLSGQTMSNLPAGREAEVLDALIKRQAVYSAVLLRLNHGPTVERIVGGFKAREGKAPGWRRTIERSGSPYIIDELAPQLYKTDVFKYRTYGEHGDSDFGESAQAAEIIGQLIIRAPEFPPESKEWAKQHLGMPGQDIIQAARAWWELNREALLANRFDQVKVPASYQRSKVVPPRLPSIDGPPPPPTPAASALAAPASDPAPPPPPAASEPPPPPAAPPAKPSHAVWWILGALAALGTAIFLRCRQKTNT